MSMTVKQLADSLGVTKTAIRKRFTEDFRANHLQTTANGVIIISDEGCKLIAETLQTTANQIPQTAETVTENTENHDCGFEGAAFRKGQADCSLDICTHYITGAS